MYCGKCGAYNNDQNQFCVNCGKNFSLDKKSGQDHIDTAPSSSHYEDITHLSFSRKNPLCKPQEVDTDAPELIRTKNSLNKPIIPKNVITNKGQFAEGFIFADRYRIENLLGAGGIGEVYKVYDINLGEIRALKVLHPALLKQEEILERFNNEAKIISQLAHINITRAMHFGEFEGNKYIIMEYINGITLRRWIKESSLKADINEILDIVIQICQGLEMAHQYTIHRDIKPDNIMLSKTGAVKIMDFGIAKSLSVKGLTQTTSSMGTAYYMSPEQTMDAGIVDERADIFSVGVILYEMMNQKVPIGHFKIPISKERRISQKLVEIVRHALEADLNDRYVSIEELRDDLEEERLHVCKQRLETKKFSFTEKDSLINNGSSQFFSFLLKTVIWCFCLLGVAYFFWQFWSTNISDERAYKKLGLYHDLLKRNNDLDEATQKSMQITTKRLGLSMNFVPGGESQMGDLLSIGEKDEFPPHRVWIDPFYLGIHEVTNRQYQIFVNETSHRYPVNVLGEENEYSLWSKNYVADELLNLPVINVSWNDAMAFCRWLSEYEGVPDNTYRLPTEAEWEKAARSGQKWKYPWGNEEATKDRANYHRKWVGALTLRKVGSFAANPMGFYDMAGNVWEWCLDSYDKDYYKHSAYRNPLAPDTHSEAVLRGGDWGSYAYLLRCSNRYGNEKSVRYYYNGFRVAREV